MKAEPTYQDLKIELEELKKRDKSQVLLDYAGVMFVELDKNGIVILVNKKTCEIIGYEEKEMLGKNWFENFLPERIKKEMLPISKKLLSGEIETAEYYENPILTKAGEERLIHWHNAVIRDNNGKIIGHLSSGEDITERKKAENKIKRQNEELSKAKIEVEESEEKFHSLFNNINVGSALHEIITDENNTPIDFVWLDSNSAYEKLTLLKRDDIVGKRGLEIIPNLEKRWIDIYGKVALTGESIKIIDYSEYLGKYWEVHAYSPKKNQFAVALKDITKQKLAEQTLTKNNEKLNTILKSFVDGVYLCSSDYEIQYLNPGMVDKIGYNAVGEKCYKAIYNLEKQCSWCYYDKLKDKTGNISVEVERDNRNYLINAVLLEDDSKLTVYHDITQTKEAEEEIKRQNVELKKSKSKIEDSEIKFRNITENISEVVYRTDDKGIINYISSSSITVFGFTPQEMEGKLFVKFLKKTEIPKAMKEFLKTVIRGTPTLDIQLKMKQKSGKIFTAELTGKRMKTENFKGTIGVIRDITERKLAEEEIKRQNKELVKAKTKIEESESKFKKLSNLTFEGIVIYKSEIAIDVNLSFAKMFGYTQEELLGKNIIKLLVSEKYHKTISEYIIKENALPYEVEGIKKDGTVFPIELEGRNISEGKDNALRVAAVRDITERKKIEEENKKLSTAVEQSVNIIVVTDTNGIIEYTNPKFTELTGYSKEEVLGKKPYILKSGALPDEIYDELWKTISSGKVWKGEFHNKTRNGEFFWEAASISPIFNEQGEITSYLKIAEDITERKQTEEALKKSEDKFKIIYDSAPDAIYLNDLKGNFIDGNKAAEKLLGYTRNELIGKSLLVLKLLPPKELFRAAKSLAKNVLGKKTGPEEFHLIRRDGSQVQVEVTTYPVVIDGKKVVLGVAHDITQRKRAEKELRKNAAILKLITENAFDFIWTLDMQMNLTYASNSVERLLGYTPVEIAKINVSELYSPEQFQLVQNILAEELAKGNPHKGVIYNAKHLRKNNTEFPVEVQATIIYNEKNEPVSIQGYTRDISSKLAAEEKLKRSEERYRSLFDHSPDPIMVHDGKKILDANPATLKAAGIKNKSDLIGVSPFILTHPDDREKSEQRLKKLIKDNKPLEPSEFRFITAQDEVRTVMATPVPINFDEKQAFMINYHDITNRKNAEKALEQSEEKYRTMIETSNDLIWMLDAKGNITFFNKHVEKATGYELKDLAGKSFVPLVLEEELPMLQEVMIKAIKGISSSYEFQLKIVDGSFLILSVNTAPMFIDGVVTGMFSFARDITQQKQDERQIKNALVKAEESEIRFRALHDATFGGIAIHDKGVILDCNLGLSEISGYTVDELIGMDGLLLIAKDSRDKVMKNILAEYEKPYEAFGVRKNGEEYPVRLEGRMIPYKGEKVRVVEFRDITFQKEAEIAVVNSEAKQGAFIENISDVIAVLDGNGIVKYKSPNIKVLFGWEPEDLVGKPGFNTVHKDDMERVQQDFYELLLVENSRKLIEYRYKCKNGLYKTVHCTAVNLISNPKIEGILLNYHDISQQKITELNLKDALGKAQESDRLKSAFLANMSHEIRTPMNGILGFSSLLKEPGLTGDQQQDYIKIIEKSGNRMLSTINDIIDISRIESGQMDVTISEVNINEQIEYLNTFFKPEAEKKGIKLSFKRGLSTQESIIKTDREKFYSILTNLVKNAIKYSHKGSIDFGYNLKEERELEFYVKDTGIGIPKERQNAIFERFVQADIEDKDVYEGSGLGLAISNAYSEMLGGTLRVESEVGVGSIFYFTIPYKVSKKTILRKEESSVDTELKIKKLKILIADDEETAELYLTLVLSKYNKEFFIARKGEQAVESCRNNPDIDLVLMDIRMPDMDGYEATRLIRKFNKDVVIIAQTAFGLIGDREKAIEAGCNEYISKPIKKNELLEKIERIFKL